MLKWPIEPECQLYTADRTEHRSVHSLQPLHCPPPPPTHHRHFRATGNLPTAHTHTMHKHALTLLQVEGSSHVHTCQSTSKFSSERVHFVLYNSENEPRAHFAHILTQKIHCHCEAFKGICFCQMPRP